MTLDGVPLLDAITTECYRTFARFPNAVLLDGDGVFGVRTEVQLPFFSGIATTQLDPADAGANIERVAAPFREKRQPFRWWITPSTVPGSLAETLKSHRFRHVYDSAGMTLDLTASPIDEPLPDGLEIRRVHKPAELDEWVEVLGIGFARPPAEFRLWRDGYGHAGLTESSPWKHFVARHRKQVVAISSVLLCGDFAGIYNVVTLPEARGRGIGAAVTRVALQLARESGARTAALQASAMGLSVYKAMGFRTVCDLVLYDWRPEYELKSPQASGLSPQI